MYSKYLVVGSIFPGIGASDISLLARALHLSSRARTTSAFSLISFHLFLYLPVFVTPPQHSRLSVTDTLIRRTYFAFPSQTIKTFWNQCVSCVQIWSVTIRRRDNSQVTTSSVPSCRLRCRHEKTSRASTWHIECSCYEWDWCISSTVCTTIWWRG